MASSFDRWEKDPYFSAAEQVQESADRMESTFRTWIHAKKDSSSMWNPEELCRDLRTTLGTTKWQLDEFARAVRASYARGPSEDARDRHREFIVAMEDQISKVENALRESAFSEGKTSLPWVRLDEGECNELASFLSGLTASQEKVLAKSKDIENLRVTDRESAPDCSKNSCGSGGSREAGEEKLHGHRRTASASADIGFWKIAVYDDGHLPSSSSMMIEQPVRKIPSFSGFISSMESASKLKWSKNGFRKWKAVDRHEDTDAALLPSTQLTKGIDACYERSKSCLDSDCYDKQLYGWYGAIQRQLQRSQYYVQYSWPAHVAFWIVLLLCLIFLIAFHAI
ncbi:hypothetical protein RchiOBHm_Chr6g0309221 [Rosa chinensis]|uniref:Syntaxin 6/10/61 N-terminal domain-containing protein n=2 Tax=Rosa chinensis TaxID=74649 RepID=A0A2P6Q0X7_ROSCH|nr:uncharacterized protein LOC112169763 isoform X1 [Rosa chinensis]PRQ27806.1 hypothetical protein RchiOBHm_Chr6g0309221 [Rosa chinensis]